MRAKNFHCAIYYFFFLGRQKLEGNSCHLSFPQERNRNDIVNCNCRWYPFSPRQIFTNKLRTLHPDQKSNLNFRWITPSTLTRESESPKKNRKWVIKKNVDCINNRQHKRKSFFFLLSHLYNNSTQNFCSVFFFFPRLGNNFLLSVSPFLVVLQLSR